MPARALLVHNSPHSFQRCKGHSPLMVLILQSVSQRMVRSEPELRTQTPTGAIVPTGAIYISDRKKSAHYNRKANIPQKRGS